MFRDLADAATSLPSNAAWAEGWAPALRRLLESLPPGQATALVHQTGTRHAGWKCLLDPTHRGAAVVIDEGWGSTAFALAQDFAIVHLLARNADHFNILQSRVVESLWSNIRIHPPPDADQLPLESQSVDVVAIFLPEFGPGTYRAPLLNDLVTLIRDATRILHAKGTLVLLSESPRQGQQLATRSWSDVLQQGCRQIQSAARMRLLLHGMKPQFYPLEPGLWNADELVLPESQPPADSGWGVTRILRHLKNMPSVRQYAAPAFAGVVSRDAEHSPLVRRVVDGVRARLMRSGYSIPSPLKIRRCLFIELHGLLLILDGGGCNFIVRVPLDGGLTLRRCLRNFRTLQEFHTPNETPGALLPAAILEDSIEGARVFVEEGKPGIPGDECMKSSLELEPRISTEAVRFLTQFHHQTSSPDRLTGDWLQEAVEEPCRRLKTMTGSRLCPDHAEAIHRGVIALIGGRALPRVRLHGDYTPQNILFRADGTLTGIIDWENSCDWGLPALDLHYFFVRRHMGLTGQTLVSTFAAYLQTPFPDPVAEHLFQGYLNALSIPSDIRLPIAVLSWVHHITHRMEGHPLPLANEGLTGNFAERVCAALSLK